MKMPTLLLALASAATLGCGSHDKSAAPNGTDPVPTEARAVVGEWSSNCDQWNDRSHNKSHQYVYTFAADNQLRIKDAAFADGLCTSKTTLAEITTTYTIGAALASPKGAVQLDIKYQDVTLSLLDATNLSVPDLCSSADDAKLKPNTPSHCTPDYVVYQIVMVDDKVLYLGNTDDDAATNDAAHRPTQLEMSVGYTAVH